MFNYRCRILTDPGDKAIFRDHYEIASGLLIPDEYLYANDVFGIVYKASIIGGFILGRNRPVRTYRLFAKEDHWKSIDEKIKEHTVGEICCLWLNKKYWHWAATSFLWFATACIVFRQQERLLVFGTISKGNQRIYSALLHARIIHSDQVCINGKKRNSWMYAMPSKWLLPDICWGLLLRTVNHIPGILNRHVKKYRSPKYASQ